MADIDRRLRMLLDVLMAQGFGWLAVEIIETLGRGYNGGNDKDSLVESQRIALNSRLLSGDANATSTPEGLKYSATRPQPRIEPLGADQQIFLAVNIFVDRLASAAEMTAKNLDELRGLMDASVSLSVETEEGEVRAIRPADARDVAVHLRRVENQLAEWLIATKPREDD
jgi:hypothetical protein